MRFRNHSFDVAGDNSAVNRADFVLSSGFIDQCSDNFRGAASVGAAESASGSVSEFPALSRLRTVEGGPRVTEQ